MNWFVKGIILYHSICLRFCLKSLKGDEFRTLSGKEFHSLGAEYEKDLYYRLLVYHSLLFSGTYCSYDKLHRLHRNLNGNVSRKAEDHL